MGLFHFLGNVAHGDSRPGGGVLGALRGTPQPPIQQSNLPGGRPNFTFIKTPPAPGSENFGIIQKSAPSTTPKVQLPNNIPGASKEWMIKLPIQHQVPGSKNTPTPVEASVAGSNQKATQKVADGVFHFIKSAGSDLIKVDKGIVNAGKQAAQYTARVPETVARSGAQASYDTLNKATGNKAPKQDFSGATATGVRGSLYGKEEVKTYQDRIKGNQEHGGFIGKAALPLGIVGALLDATPLGGARKSLTEQLAKADSVKAVKKLIPGIEDSKAQAIASQKDPHIIDNIVSGTNKVPSPVHPPAPPLTPGEATKTAGQGTAASLPKRLGAVQRAALSVSGELSKQGPAGQEIADRLSKARDISEKGQAEFVQKIPTVLDLKKDEFHQFHDALVAADKGETLKVDPKVQQAVTEWTQNIPSIRDKAVAVGEDVGNLGPNYFPRNYTELLKSDEGRNIAAEHLVKSGQADSLGEAAMALDNMKAKYNTPFGHFENSRTSDLPGYDISKDAIIGYISGAFNKIGHTSQFGPHNEGAKELITTLGKEGHDIHRALRNFQIASGTKQYDSATVDAASKSLRGFNRFRSLGLSSLLNATQSNNTAAVSGIWRTASSAFKSFTPTEKQYIKDTGVIIDSVLNNLREGAGVAGKVTGKLTAPAFGTVEKFNRSVAAIAGKDYAKKLAAKGDAKSLGVLRDKLGIEGDIGAQLTKDQEIQAGRKMVELTQFKVDPMDLPGWTNSSGGKLVAQFRTFQYKQTGFIFNQLLKEAKTGNPAPLARFIAIGIPLGVGAGTIRNTLRGQPGVGARGNQEDPSTNHWSQAMEGLANVGAFGLGPTDAKFLAQNSKSQRFPEYVAGAIGGPTAGFAVGTVTDAGKATAGDLKPLERRGLKSLSTPGPAIQNKLLPYSSLSKSESDIVAELKKEGADKNTVSAYTSFFGVTAPKATGSNKQVNAAILAGNYDKAQSIADSYNEQLAKAYDNWATRHGQYATQDLQSKYDSKKITLSESKITSVLKSNQKKTNLLGK